MLKTLIGRASGVALATAIGHGLVLLTTPYLARHYSPAEFGALALLMTVSNISTAVACLRYDLALPSADSRDARSLVMASVISSAALGGLAVFGLTLFPDSLGRIAAPLTGHPALVGFCVFIAGCYQAAVGSFLRGGVFRAVAGLRFSQGATFCMLAATTGMGLLWAHALSFCGGIFALKDLAKPKRADEKGLAEVVSRYRQFPTLSLPGAVLDVIGYSMFIWIVANIYGAATAGNYSQIQRLIGAPMMLASISLGQILLKQTADLSANRTALRELLTKTFKLMAVLAVAGFIVLWFFGEPIIGWLLGPQWTVDRALIVQIAVAVAVRACVSPLSTILITLRRFKTALLWQLSYFCSAAVFLTLIATRISFARFVSVYMVHECLFYGFYLVLIHRSISPHPESPH